MTVPRPYALLAEITVPMSAALPVLLKPTTVDAAVPAENKPTPVR